MTTAPVPPPQTLSYSSGYNTGNCPLCRVRPMWKKRLYGQGVCKKCYYRFANRRQIAYLIDAVLFTIPTALIGFGIGYGLVRAKVLTGNDDLALQLILIPISLVFGLLFVCKDGFAGQSPGKRLAGVQVIDNATNQPIGFQQSFKRNSPLLFAQIPFVGKFVALVVVIVIAVQLNKGRRWGDRYANTRVIWKRYAELPIFGGSALACGMCGYDLNGNTSGVCPECGAAVSNRVHSRTDLPPVPNAY